MKRRGYLALVFLVVVSALLFAGGCGFGGGGNDGLSSDSTSLFSTPANTDSAADTTTTLTPADGLSTFKAKDPFVQQAQPTTTTTAATSTSSGSSSTSSSTSSTTTTAPLSDTASVHIHSLKVLSIHTGPTVSFKVDSVVYDAKKVGDVVTTTWGQVKVLSIDTSAQCVKLLHGSETLKLEVGQTTFE